MHKILFIISYFCNLILMIIDDRLDVCIKISKACLELIVPSTNIIYKSARPWKRIPEPSTQHFQGFINQHFP
ncbi:hypothetical protein HanHA300_Chr07g0249641 [Helianthus annuus]|nr:hypothetical protein HanHA300_Chr07g0249641 [Helianthus annuus]KAJ0563737.1 hypothetical protein HanHA89_Chr07g0266461 [Helianthus annuus]KAJ0729069.1 hypothetical protein HanLR1_Chr07g0248761 [Helianthus annuus]KAJ0731818.1 hypothetical protein HanOQP8_Chr07g0256251 [Helianthus annuus]